MPNRNRTWKATERAIAKRLGGQRVGNLGKAAADIQASWTVVEVKCRKRLPAWLLGAVRQARANTWGDRLPLVVLHETGQRHDNDLVVMTLADFEQWHGPLQTELGNDPDAPGEPIP